MMIVVVHILSKSKRKIIELLDFFFVLLLFLKNFSQFFTFLFQGCEPRIDAFPASTDIVHTFYFHISLILSDLRLLVHLFLIVFSLALFFRSHQESSFLHSLSLSIRAFPRAVSPHCSH
jgi:hypothetical protein